MNNQRRVSLHNWFITTDDGIAIAHGNVTGHRKQPDGIHIHTSVILNLKIDIEHEEVIIITKNTKYHCPLRHCRFKIQDKYPDVLPNHEWLKEKYEQKN